MAVKYSDFKNLLHKKYGAPTVESSQMPTMQKIELMENIRQPKSMTGAGYAFRRAGAGATNSLIGIENAVRSILSKSQKDTAENIQDYARAYEQFKLENPQKADKYNVDSFINAASSMATELYASSDKLMRENIIDRLTGYKEKKSILDNEAGSQGKAARFLGEVSEGVGGLLPYIAAGAVAGPTASLAALGLSSGGNEASFAYDNGASIDEAVGAGAKTAAKEIATEKIIGGIGGLGGGYLDNLVKKAIGGNKLAGRVVNALGEGLEEVISDRLQYYIDKEWNENAERSNWGESLHSGLIGTVISILLGGSDQTPKTNIAENISPDVLLLPPADVNSNKQQAARNTSSSVLNKGDYVGMFEEMLNRQNIAAQEKQMVTEMQQAAQNAKAKQQPLQNTENPVSQEAAIPIPSPQSNSVFNVDDIKPAKDILKDRQFLAYAKRLGYSQKTLRSEPQTLRAVYEGFAQEKAEEDRANFESLEREYAGYLATTENEVDPRVVDEDSILSAIEQAVRETDAGKTKDNPTGFDVDDAIRQIEDAVNGDTKQGESLWMMQPGYIPEYTEAQRRAALEDKDFLRFARDRFDSSKEDLLGYINHMEAVMYEYESGYNTRNKNGELVFVKPTIKMPSDRGKKDSAASFFERNKRAALNVPKNNAILTSPEVGNNEQNGERGTYGDAKQSRSAEAFERGRTENTGNSRGGTFSQGPIRGGDDLHGVSVADTTILESSPEAKAGSSYVALYPEQVLWVSDGKSNQSSSDNGNSPPKDTLKMNLTEKPKDNYSFREKAGHNWDKLIRRFINTGHTIERMDQGTGKNNLRNLFNRTHQSLGMANFSIGGDYQTDFNGEPIFDKSGRPCKSLASIFKPINQQGKKVTQQFHDYLRHWHNIDRMKVERPVFTLDGSWTPQESAKRIAEYDKQHPEFRATAEEVWGYSRNWLRLLRDSGIISSSEYEKLSTIYPHYVPTHRAGKDGFRGSKKSPTGNPMKKAKGGDSDFLPLDMMMANQTINLYRNVAVNRLGLALAEQLEKGNSIAQQHIRFADKSQIKDKMSNADDYIESLAEGEVPIGFSENSNGNSTLTVLKNGKPITLILDAGVADGIKAAFTSSRLSDKYGIAGEITEKAVQTMKDLVTTYDPTFIVRNFLKDQFSALINTKNLGAYSRNLKTAYLEMANNGPLWQKYKALGGPSITFFNPKTGEMDREVAGTETPVDKIKREINLPLEGVQKANSVIEQFPRFTEFLAVYEETGDIDEALYAAADITVNFSRSGTAIRSANKVVPFLNAAIQGLDKNFRVLTQTKDGRTWGRMVAVATITGIAPQLLNELLWGDDEDYKNLNLRDKANYFLVKMKNGKFIKLPKGRPQAVLAGFSQSVINAITGEDPELDNALSVLIENAAPANPLENNIFAMGARAALFDKENPGKTWYGSDIESVSDQYKPVSQRYDETTSKWFVELGKKLNLSPKKLQNIFETYSGVIGDIVIPPTTPQAERSWLESKFVLDPVYSNNLSDKFYENKTKYEQAKKDETLSDEEKDKKSAVSRYISNQAGLLSDLYGRIDAIQMSNVMHDDEKSERARALREQINFIMGDTNDKIDDYNDVIESIYKEVRGNNTKGDIVDELYLLANREIFGSEYALKEYNKDVYGKAQSLNKDSGISYDDIFDFYFKKKEISANSDTTSAANGAAREYLYNMNTLSNEQKRAMDKAFINDGMYIPREYDVDYSDEESFIITQMSSAGQKAWARMEKYSPDVLSAEEFNDLYSVISASGSKKAEKIEAIKAYTGWSDTQATTFWNIVQGNNGYK